MIIAVIFTIIRAATVHWCVDCMLRLQYLNIYDYVTYYYDRPM